MQNPKDMAPGATGTTGLSRRHLLGSSVGIGAYLVSAGAVRAADHVHGKMDMSPTMGMVPDKAAPAMDQPLVEPEVRRSANGVLSTTLRLATATVRSAASGSMSGPMKAAARDRRCA